MLISLLQFPLDKSSNFFGVPPKSWESIPILALSNPKREGANEEINVLYKNGSLEILWNCSTSS